MVAVCTMWDDGLVSDLPLIEALNARKIKASFALSPGRYKAQHEPNDPRGPYGTLISGSEIKLYTGHDIVSHSLHHHDLTTIPSDKLREELKLSRDWLSSVFKRPIRGLCYPYGRTDKSTQLMAAEYYSCARSLAPASKGQATHGKFTNRYDVQPSAHWAVPNLAQWVLSVADQRQRVLIWGHTYEFGRDGLQRALTLYDQLAAGGARFVTFEEIVHDRYD